MKSYTMAGKGELAFADAISIATTHHHVMLKSCFLGTDGRWAISVEAGLGLNVGAPIISGEPMDFTFDDMANLMFPWLTEEGEQHGQPVLPTLPSTD